ncbi:MAG: hypothetical protein M4D80_22450 [Myxococcota bacterium]|nr:hypothetical protein [Myxococcota bacterium]
MGEGCPKCGAARDDARTSCAACGLAHDKMAAFEKARAAVPDALGLAWDRAVENWDDKAHHDEVLRLVTQHDTYAWAAARYRDRLRAKPDDAVATAQLERVRRAAEATMMANAASRKVKTPEPYRATMAILALLIIMIVAGLVYAMSRTGDADEGRRDPTPPGQRK